jgi:hypothetical protein
LTLQTRALAGLLGIAFSLAILELIRRHKLQERYSALWLLVGIGLVLCAIVPRLLMIAAKVLGVRDTNVALFVVVIGGLLLVVLHLTVVVSQQSEHITRLAQELAIAHADDPLQENPAQEREARQVQGEDPTPAKVVAYK